MCTDVEVSVKNGAELLDRLVKDIVSEHPKFDVANFIPLLRERLQVTHPFARQFLVSWIVLLDSVPEINFITFLPDFLNDLFVFLGDSNVDIRTTTSKALLDLLEELKQLTPEDIPKFSVICTEILKSHMLSEDEETQLMAITWINDLTDKFPGKMIPLISSLVTHILPTLAHISDRIRTIAEVINQQFFKMIKEAEPSLVDFQPLVQSLIYLFLNGKEPCRIACLDWLIMLHTKSPKDTFTPDGNAFPTLLKTLSDSSDEVIKRDLRLLSQIAVVCDEDHFKGFLGNLLDLFRHDRRLLEARSGLIIRQLCVSLSSERIYLNLALILETEKVSVINLCEMYTSITTTGFGICQFNGSKPNGYLADCK